MAWKNKEKEKEYNKQYREIHNWNEYCRNHYKILKNKIKRQKWQSKYKRERRKKDKIFCLNGSISGQIRACLNGKKSGRHWEKLVGYTLLNLVNHLENQFNEKMGWDNYGSYWQIDHIKPQSLFKYNSVEDQEFKECWALKNLQPLEKTENNIKNNKYELS